jgi:hypothetical protein
MQDHGGTEGHSGTGTGTETRWLTAAEACERWGIQPRALRKRVESGSVARRRLGRVSLYRPADSGTEAHTEAPRGHLVAVSGTGGGAPVATIAAPAPAPMPEPVRLADLVARLSAELARAEAERGEAVGIAWGLSADCDRLVAERDAAQAHLVELQRRLLHLVDSTLSFPVRGRLAGILRDTLH